MKKADDKFILQFPKDSGFTDTEIYFYSGTPDIMGIYFSEQNEQKHLPFSHILKYEHKIHLLI